MSKTGNNNSNTNKSPNPKSQMPNGSVRINLAMEIPSKPVKPTTPPPSDKK